MRLRFNICAIYWFIEGSLEGFEYDRGYLVMIA